MPRPKKKPVEPPRLNAATRKIFLTHLAETANVAASSRIAGIASNAVYAERRRSAVFRADWAESLGEGYARLEADLLAEALQAANGTTSDSTLKARAQKHRLRIALLSAHRSSVKTPAAIPVAGARIDLKATKALLILTLTKMRERAGKPLDGKSEDGDAGTRA